MLGAYIGYTLTDRLSGAVGFWAAIVLAALCVAAIGTLIEMLLLRRIYDAPVLFQLLATFGVTLVVEDLVLLIWGPGELLGPRAPGFKGAIDLFGHPFPTYDLLLIALAPLVLAFIWLALPPHDLGRAGARRDSGPRDGRRRSASTRNGCSPVSSRSASFSLALAARLNCRGEAANHTMDVQVITEALVVVVIGGLGSVTGHLPRGDHRLRAQRLWHPRLSEDLDRPRLPGDGDRADRAALGTARARGGGRADRERRGLFPLAPIRRARPAARRPRLGGRSASAARRGQLCPWRRDGSAHLHALCGEPPFSARGRGSRLLRSRRLFRPRLLRRGDRAEIVRARHGDGDPRWRASGIRRRARLRLVLRAPLRRLFRHADACLRPDRLVDRLSMDRCDGRRQRHHRRLAERLGRLARALLLADACA